MDVESALLQAIHESPGDDLAWLALGDHLEERGEGERAELLRLTVALHARPFGAEAAVQAARVQALLASGVRPCVPTRTNPLGMQFSLIRAGTFLMGSPVEEAGHSPGEGPQHEVEITRPFYLGIYPVTQEQYEKITGTNPSAFSASGDREDRVKGLDTRHFPVENVSWEEARAVCQALSEWDGGKGAYSLPTEGQWEYACRVGAPSTPFHFGTTLASTQANFKADGPKGADLDRTCPVGSYPPNALGLYDMHGNVHEYCADWYDENYYHYSPRRDPQGPPVGTCRSFRGGSYHGGPVRCRAAHRGWCDPVHQFGAYNVGFRVLFSA